jgi:hypothetical protein
VGFSEGEVKITTMENGTMKLATNLLLAAALATLTACATSSNAPAVSEDGLKLVKTKDIDTLYWADGASLAAYESVKIERPTVSFRKNWMRDQNSQRRSVSDRIRAEDMERISNMLADEFVERFSMRLSKAGYNVTDTNGENVLKLNPAIVELDVTAPDISRRTAGMQTTYTTDTTGEMTLQLEMFDGPTGAIIGRATDRRKSWGTGQIQVTNQITNRSDAIIILDSWAKQLVEALDEAKTH